MLKTRGYAGASAREIAKAGDLNQALIFYHYGNVQGALLAALDRVSDRRMSAYRQAFEGATSLAELAALAGEIYREDLENEYVTVLAEMVAGGMSDPDLGRQIVARIEPWVEMVEHKVRALIAGSMFEPLVAPRELAFAIIALYLGIDMLGQLDGDHARAGSLLDLGARGAPLLQALLPAHIKETSDAQH